MSGCKLRWLGLGLAATASVGALGLTATMNPTVAHADGEDIGLVIGASGVPIPGSLYVEAANHQYLDNGPGGVPIYPDLTFYQATSTDPHRSPPTSRVCSRNYGSSTSLPNTPPSARACSAAGASESG
jgi:hypothetical protein